MASLLGWAQSTVARVESGQRAKLYDVRNLFEVADALDMPRSVLIPMITGNSEGTDGRTEEETLDSMINRRELGASLTGVAVVAGLSRVKIPERVDGAHVRYLHTALRNFYSRDQSQGGGALARDGLGLYYRVRKILDESSYTDQTAQELIGIACESAVCAGWLFHDAGNSRVARALYNEARRVANQSEDSDLAVHAMANSALLLIDWTHLSDGPANAREAIRLTRRAAALTPPARSYSVYALISAREAVAHSALGNSSEFRSAMARSWRAMDRVESPEFPHWASFADRSEIAFHEARGLSNLGDHKAAVELCKKDVGETRVAPRNNVSTRAFIAATLAASGDTAAAVPESLAVLDALEESPISSGRTMRRLGIVRNASANIDAADELRERLDRLASGPTAVDLV